jgi:hypothetical protein
MSSVAERISSDVQKLIRDFGETFSYTNADNETAKIQLIFDNAFELASPGNLDYSGTAPVALGATSDVEGLTTREVQFTRASTNVIYYFLKHEPDGSGLSLVYLSTDTPHG